MSPTVKTPSATETKIEEPAQILKRVVSIIDELSDLMMKEEILIQTRKSIEHAELLKRKQRLTIDYRSTLKMLAARPDVLKQIPENLRLSAKTAARKLADISERNARYLRGAILAGEKLAEAVFAIIKDEFVPKGSYVNPKTAALALGTYSPTCKPVTVNRRV